MTEEWKSWWLWYVKSKTPEGHFYLPLEPKNLNDMTGEEFDLLDNSDWKLITENEFGITYFLCKNKNVE